MKKFYLPFFTLFILGIACKKDKYAAPPTQEELDSRRHHDQDFKFKSFNQVNLVANNANYGLPMENWLNALPKKTSSMHPGA